MKGSKLLKGCIFTALFFMVTSHTEAYEACCESPCDEPWIIKLEGAATGGQFIGQDRDYVELGAFVAPRPCGDLFYFGDARAFWLEGKRFAASAGLGVRWLERGNGYLFGGNVYYDYCEGDQGGFNRIGVGLEMLTTCFDIRVNGYIPLTESNQSSGKTYNYLDGYRATLREKEYAYKGVDAEIGAEVWDGCWFDLYAAIGPYYYGGNKLPDVAGGFARLEAHFLDYFTVEGRVSDDNRYHWNAQGRISVSVPLDTLFSCCTSTDRCLEFFAQPVKRNPLPFFYKCCDWKWNW
ncbi:inverse autotransporter beta domain-containing protein [Estrella lausannensis]|uniref:Putative secreted protein n=1 Tax=Estrella lausannensis TaxID=483423 RepID=A0A0H5DPX2_9BACT|nr:inverse autotransporter beta domain-containing protein [Estrella lausannensis]CRX37564.1 putative secreted protein [Estrella lausannensis]